MNIELRCYECDKVLEVRNARKDSSNVLRIEVELCPSCSNKIDEEGYDRGYECGVTDTEEREQ